MSAAVPGTPLTTAGGRVRDERGSSAVELALLVPALVMVLGLLVGGARLWFARTTVTEAAQSTARAASLARTAGEAQSSAATAGRASLSTGGLQCRDQSVTVDVGGFAQPVGTPAAITSSVTCVVSFSDVLLPGMPGSISLQGRGVSALDTYRSRR